MRTASDSRRLGSKPSASSAGANAAAMRRCKSCSASSLSARRAMRRVAASGAFSVSSHVGVGLVSEGEGEIEHLVDRCAPRADVRPQVADQPHALDGAQRLPVGGERSERRSVVQRAEEASLVGVAVDETRRLPGDVERRPAGAQQLALGAAAPAAGADAAGPRGSASAPRRCRGRRAGPCRPGSAPVARRITGLPPGSALLEAHQREAGSCSIHGPHHRLHRPAPEASESAFHRSAATVLLSRWRRT